MTDDNTQELTHEDLGYMIHTALVSGPDVGTARLVPAIPLEDMDPAWFTAFEKPMHYHTDLAKNFYLDKQGEARFIKSDERVIDCEHCIVDGAGYQNLKLPLGKEGIAAKFLADMIEGPRGNSTVLGAGYSKNRGKEREQQFFVDLHHIVWSLATRCNVPSLPFEIDHRPQDDKQANHPRDLCLVISGNEAVDNPNVSCENVSNYRIHFALRLIVVANKGLTVSELYKVLRDQIRTWEQEATPNEATGLRVIVLTTTLDSEHLKEANSYAVWSNNTKAAALDKANSLSGRHEEVEDQVKTVCIRSGVFVQGEEDCTDTKEDMIEATAVALADDRARATKKRKRAKGISSTLVARSEARTKDQKKKASLAEQKAKVAALDTLSTERDSNKKKS